MTARRVVELEDAPPDLRAFIFRRAIEMLARDGAGIGIFVEADDPNTYWIQALSLMPVANPEPRRVP